MLQTFGAFVYRRSITCLLAATFIFAVSPGASGGQKNKKTKKADASSQPAPAANLTPESDQIDNDIGEMLAAFPLGNADMMHQYYGDNVTFVSADYEPKVVGWQNYAPLYERQRAAFQAIQLNRRNTLVFIHGDVAWAEYQWQFDSMLNGQPYSMRGQTTLLFNRVGTNWLILHNHTSQLYTPTAATAQISPPQQNEAPSAPAKQ